ncbi:UBAP1-MVB12-associated (UMA)-domain containing protein 1 [Neosynchiropus ocellatus]
MLSFFGLRKDSKKSQSEKESEGGFVIIGETVEEERQKKRAADLAHRSTNVIVVPSKPSCSALTTTTSPTATQTQPSPVEEEALALPDLLKDVPFTLAPHVKAIQMNCSIPCLLQIEDRKCNISSFHYEFTLENSVLQNA